MWLKTYILGLDAREKSMWEMEETRPGGEFVGSSVEPCGQREEAECHGREKRYFFAVVFWRNMNQRCQKEELAVKRTSTPAVARKAKGYSHSYAPLV